MLAVAFVLVTSTLVADEPPVSLVDRVVARSLLDDGKQAEAKAVVPALKLAGPKRDDANAPSGALADLAKGEALLAKKTKDDAKLALVAFKRALAKAPKSAAPLWGIARADDAVGDALNARRYAGLYVKSAAADKDPAVQSAAQWRLEQPDELAPAPKPGAPTTGLPTSTAPGIPTGAVPSTSPTTPPAPPQPY